ncbi:hypothetical protein CLOP_g8430, partial [Closterium sp. NIES-67]
LATLIRKHTDIFPDDLPAGLPPERDHDHTIELEPSAQPTIRTQWRLTEPELDELRHQLDYLVEKGFVRPSTSPFAAPILFTPKKDGGLRMCIDYRALNRVTIKSRYPIPRADELIDQLRGAKFFSKIDLRGGYHQIRVHEVDCFKTAFRTRYGSYEYTVMPFGLTNAPLMFQLTMNECKFLKQELEFLEHVISVDGVKIDPKKIATIQDWTPPTNLRELQSFLGFVNYVRRYIPNMAGVTSPLTDLRKKGKFYEWGGEQQASFMSGGRAAFEQLKLFLTTPPVLRIADPHRPFELITDASDLAVGTVLLQDFGEGLQPIAYEFRKLNPAERDHPVHEKELLAIVHAFKVWRCYLTGADVTIRWLDYLELLQPLEPPSRPWQQVTMDFVTGLPAGSSGNDAILVVVDRLTKMAHFAASKTTITAEQTAKPFLTNIVRLHGIPSVIVSDRDPRFTSNFWTKTWQQYGTRLHLSTTYHPQSDGQTERTNQTIEQLIRTTCTDSAQWEDSLPLIEFAYNNAPSTTTTQSPFFLNYGIDSTTPLSPPIENPAPRSQQFVENL